LIECCNVCTTSRTHFIWLWQLESNFHFSGLQQILSLVHDDNCFFPKAKFALALYKFIFSFRHFRYNVPYFAGLWRKEANVRMTNVAFEWSRIFGLKLEKHSTNEKWDSWWTLIRLVNKFNRNPKMLITNKTVFNWKMQYILWFWWNTVYFLS
jgi:hypothetical protein